MVDLVELSDRLRRWLRDCRRRGRQRRLLMSLGDRLLKDIGYGRGDVEREYAKPCWRD